jgi:hypothetical protein
MKIYTLKSKPFGRTLGRFACALFVGKKVKGIFEHRFNALEERLTK